MPNTPNFRPRNPQGEILLPLQPPSQKFLKLNARFSQRRPKLDDPLFFNYRVEQSGADIHEILWLNTREYVNFLVSFTQELDEEPSVYRWVNFRPVHDHAASQLIDFCRRLYIDHPVTWKALRARTWDLYNIDLEQTMLDEPTIELLHNRYWYQDKLRLMSEYAKRNKKPRKG